MSARDAVLDAVARGVLAPSDLRRALTEVDGVVTASTWRRLGLAFLLAAGLLALATGVLFLVAWNWADLHRFAKLGLVAGALLAAVTVYIVARPGSALRIAMVPTTLLLIGLLLALTGQIYQSGADPWQLFAIWALVGLPLVAGTRSLFGWLPWLALANVAVALWAEARLPGISWLWSKRLAGFWALAAANGVFAVLAGIRVLRCESPGYERALERVALWAAGACLTWLVLAGIFDISSEHMPAFVAWGAFLAVLWFRYRHLRIDLPMLAGLALSLCTVLVAGFVRSLDALGADFGFGSGLLIAAFIVALAAVAGRWLLSQQRVHTG